MAARRQPSPASNVKKRRKVRKGEAALSAETCPGSARARGSAEYLSLSVIEANFVYQFAGQATMLDDVRQRQRINHQGAKAGNHRIKLDAVTYRVFVVGVGIQMLRLLGDQVFKQGDGVVF